MRIFQQYTSMCNEQRIIVHKLNTYHILLNYTGYQGLVLFYKYLIDLYGPNKVLGSVQVLRQHIWGWVGGLCQNANTLEGREGSKPKC